MAGIMPPGTSRQTGPSRQNRLLAALEAATLSSLGGSLDESWLAAGTVLFEPGDPIDRVYFPQTGLAFLQILFRDGSGGGVAMVGREGAIGSQRAFGPRISTCRTEVQIGGVFSSIAGGRIEEIASVNPVFRDLIRQYLEVALMETQQLAACNAKHGASHRLCSLILQCADRVDNLELFITQEALAEFLGVQRTTVTLLMRDLQEKDLVTCGRGSIRIINRTALEKLACECYETIHRKRRSHGS